MDVVAKDAREAHEVIERLAKERAVAEVRRVSEIRIGQVVRQGDVYIHRVDDRHPRGERAETGQLAVGNTAGSRHVAEAPAEAYDGLRIPQWCAVGTFLGPCVVSAGRFVVSHPEHAHVELPAGVYQVTHQMDPRSRERVRD